MAARKPTRRPSYEWLRTLALAELPHHADRIHPEFWQAIETAVSRMQPTQRKVYMLYRCGMSVAGIAPLMGWSRESVRVRLHEISDLLRTNISANSVRPEFK